MLYVDRRLQSPVQTGVWDWWTPTMASHLFDGTLNFHFHFQTWGSYRYMARQVEEWNAAQQSSV
jgi:hypothetical protein